MTPSPRLFAMLYPAPQTLLVGLLIALTCGCSFTRMETANQLRDDETVLGGSIDNIGYGPVPRFNFVAMRGIEDRGDFSVHAGTSLLTANAGLGGRYYLSERVTLGIQGDISTVLIDLPFTDHSTFDPVIATAVPRITTATKEGEFVYAGLQANLLTALHTESPSFMGGVGGLVFGLDFGDRSDGGGLQGELVLYPLQYRDREWSFFADLNEGEILLFQISIGVYTWR